MIGVLDPDLPEATRSIRVDEVGLGGGVTDRLDELKRGIKSPDIADGLAIALYPEEWTSRVGIYFI